MHKVFVNDKPLQFIDTYNAGDLKKTFSGKIITENDMTVEETIYRLETSKARSGNFYMSENPDAAWKIFLSHCSLIEASGGLVRNRKEEYLIIFRNGKWDLPKGKMEYNETPELTAVREVGEECGLQHLEIVKPLSKTFHTYRIKKKRMLKKTHWFLMNALQNEKLIPQEEEGIEKAEWMTLTRIQKEVFRNTYSSVAELLEESFRFKV